MINEATILTMCCVVLESRLRTLHKTVRSYQRQGYFTTLRRIEADGGCLHNWIEEVEGLYPLEDLDRWTNLVHAADKWLDKVAYGLVDDKGAKAPEWAQVRSELMDHHPQDLWVGAW